MKKKDIERSIIQNLLAQGEENLYFKHDFSSEKQAGFSSQGDIRGAGGTNEVSGISSRNIISAKQPKRQGYKLPSVDFSDKAEELGNYRGKICNCKKCRLGEKRLNFVFGEGNPNADIMFIGEAPGKDEDESGRPFVGRAGQLLTKIIEAMNYKREDVYICNILKCRPPNNRDPQDDEISECIDYLLHQIAVIQPRIIIFLGRIASHALLETKEPMRELRKIMHSFAGIPAVVTYHPAALLRNVAYKRPTWEDMKRVIAFLNNDEK